MDRALIPLGLDNVGQLPDPCRTCVNWELGPAGARALAATGQADFEKEVWLSGMMLQWGSCGQILQVDGETAGFALFAPPSAVPAAAAFPTGPVSPDAVLLMAAKVLPRHVGHGHGRYLIQGVARELTRRGVKAIELFGHRGDLLPEVGEDEIPPCLVPAEFALSLGFTEIRPHHRFPRLRLENDAALGWKADVESALERLFTVIVMPAAPVAEPAKQLVPVGACAAPGVAH